MDFKVTGYKRCEVIKGVGRIDSATAPDIEKVLNKLISNKTLPEFLLSFEDDFIEKNNKTFWIKNNQLLTVEKKASEKNIDHISLNIRDFVPIFTGYMGLSEKYNAGCIAVNGKSTKAWNQYDIPEILKTLEYYFPKVFTYSTEFCF